MYTQLDERRIIAQRERDDAAAAAAQELERDARQAAYDAEQAEFDAFLATNPSSPDLFGPLSPEFTPSEEAIRRRVLSLDRPIRLQSVQDNPDTFFGNQQHLANALEHDTHAEAQRQVVARDFIRNTNAARIRAEAEAAAAAAKKQGKGISKKGGQRKTLKKTKLKSKLRSKSKRKSNKYKVQKKTSQRRRHI
jgi:hypothetical protein